MGSGISVHWVLNYFMALFLIICCSFSLIFQLEYLDFNTTKGVISKNNGREWFQCQFMLSSSITLPPTLNISIYSYNIFDLYAVSKPFSTTSSRLTNVRFSSCIFLAPRYNHHFKGKDKSETNSPHLHSENIMIMPSELRVQSQRYWLKGLCITLMPKHAKWRTKKNGSFFPLCSSTIPQVTLSPSKKEDSKSK